MTTEGQQPTWMQRAAGSLCEHGKQKNSGSVERQHVSMAGGKSMQGVEGAVYVSMAEQSHTMQAVRRQWHM
jgi:hypothetical protein